MKFIKIFLFVLTVAFCSGAVAPEFSLVAQAKKSAEYPILRRLQDLTLDLQLLEITIKNRRDEKLEEKITSTLDAIEQQGADVNRKFRAIRQQQLEELGKLLEFAAQRGIALGIARAEWNEIRDMLASGQVTSGGLRVHTSSGSLNVLTLVPLTMGKNVVWTVLAPAKDRKNFWIRARTKLGKRLDPINAPYAEAETLAKSYFTGGYAKLYSAFENHRYVILQRITAARKALVELGKSNTAMGTPEEYGTLYNQVLENLFSYGIDVAPMTFKGFLFAEDPQRARALVDRLRFSPSNAAYNSPES